MQAKQEIIKNLGKQFVVALKPWALINKNKI